MGWVDKGYMSFGEFHRHCLLHSIEVRGPTIPRSIGENGSCYGYWIFLIYFLDFFLPCLLRRESQRDTYLNPYSEFILILLDIIYSQMTPFRKQSFLLELEPLSFLTMPYSVITIVAMLTYQSACGCVCQSTWESLTICFFIVSYLNIIINAQTSKYLLGYLPVKSTRELLEN
jgi:hypothetical protein